MAVPRPGDSRSTEGMLVLRCVMFILRSRGMAPLRLNHEAAVLANKDKMRIGEQSVEHAEHSAHDGDQADHLGLSSMDETVEVTSG